MKIIYSKGIIITLFLLFALDLQAQQKEDFINACKTGNMKVVKRTVKDGFDINSKLMEDGTTGLMVAASKGQLDVAKYLIEKGAEVNATREFGYSALMISIQKNQAEMARFLIEKGADVNARNKLSETPFIFAVEECNKEIINLLIEKHVDINIKTKVGQKPLLIAATKGCKEVVDVLIKNGVDIEEASQTDSTTALMKAAKFGHYELVKMLLQNGAKLDKKNRFGNTALMLAVQNNQIEIVKQLLEAGGDVNNKNILGYTPLLYALDFHQPEMIKFLIEKGADVNVEANNKVTPMKIVKKNKDSVMVAFLIEKGAIEKEEVKEELTKANAPKKNIVDDKKFEQLKLASIKDNTKEVIIHAQIDEIGKTNFAKIIYSSTEDSIFDKAVYETIKNKKWNKEKDVTGSLAVWKFFSIKYDEKFAETKLIEDSAVVEISNIDSDLANIPVKEIDDQIAFIPYDEPPQPIGGFSAIQKELEYPEIARKSGIQGTVVIYTKVDSNGDAIKTKVVKPLGNSGCNEAAIRAIKKVKWKPAIQGEKPETAWLAVSVKFNLTHVKKEETSKQEEKIKVLASNSKNEINLTQDKKEKIAKQEVKLGDLALNNENERNLKQAKKEKISKQKEKADDSNSNSKNKDKQFDVSPEPVDGFEKIQSNLKVPKIVKDGKVSGTVVINVKISEKGKIKKTTFVKLLMNKKCNSAALDAIKSVKWKPAEKDGKPITATVDVPIEFKQ